MGVHYSEDLVLFGGLMHKGRKGSRCTLGTNAVFQEIGLPHPEIGVLFCTKTCSGIHIGPFRYLLSFAPQPLPKQLHCLVRGLVADSALQQMMAAVAKCDPEQRVSIHSLHVGTQQV